MSMISAQCDRLRERAATLRQGRWSDGEDDATLMERAAGTIWELRNKLSGVVDQQDEIERLKEQVRWLKKGDVLHVLTDQELADQQKHEREMRASIDALDADNNTLREMLSESRQANEHIFTELKRYKDVMRTRPIAMNALFDENAKLRELVRDMFKEIEAGGFDPMVERHGKSTVYYEEDPSWRVGIRERVRELGLEVRHV